MSGRRSSNTTRDWPFGSETKRLLLRAVLRAPCPEEGWSASDLARFAGRASPHGTIDDHLAGMVQLKLLVKEGDRFKRHRPEPVVAQRLDSLLRSLDRLPNARINKLPRREYRKTT